MREKMPKHTDDLFVAEVIGCCFNHARTIEEITNKIYKNQYAKNIVRVYQCCMILMKHGILAPKVKERTLKFQVNRDELIKRG